MASTTIVAAVRQFLATHPPFSQLSAEDLDFVSRHLELAYYAHGETLIGPGGAAPEVLFIVKQGVVEGLRPRPGRSPAAGVETVLHLTPGEAFPVGALMADRPVTSLYRAAGDTFCWLLSKAHFEELARRSPPFLDFCRRRIAALLDLSNEALQASYAAQATQWREMSAPLSTLLRRPPVTCTRQEPLREVFARIEEEGVGSVVVVDPAPAPGLAARVAGIFTRQDVLARVLLPGVPLDTPIGRVMTSPVITLDRAASVADAIMMMAERSIRHLPVTGPDGLAGIITERDLFVLQRRSMRQIGDAIRLARGVGELGRACADIREWSVSLVAQGVAAGFVTRLISSLNDQVTARLIALTAREQDVAIDGVCWLALGSEGRQEQTIATDQDNGLVYGPQCALAPQRLLAFAATVNQRLAECGYPSCQGGIMAGNPRWCLSIERWRDLFDDWIARGDPESLLHASIFFDFRAVAGEAALADALRTHVAARACANARFLKQMCDNALRIAPPVSWAGGVIGQLFAAQALSVDLKMSGTTPFVDAARLLALAHGVTQTGTAARLQALAAQGAIPIAEARAWIDAFEFLQSLRLRAQHRGSAASGNPNLLDTGGLSELDRRILKEAFRQARKIQQRIALDYPG